MISIMMVAVNRRFLYLPRVVRATLNVIVHRLVGGDEKQFAAATRAVDN